MSGYMFLLVVVLILPLVAAIFMGLHLKTFWPVLLGAATFLVFQGLLRIPLLQWVLPKSVDYVLFQFTHPILYLLFLSVTAGIFEEVGRYVVMKRFMTDAPIAHAIGFGIGHGGIEAILLVGLNLIITSVTGALMISDQGSQFYVAGFERLFAMVFHICLSVMVWRSLREKKPSYLFLAILLHTLLNALALYLLIRQVSVLVIEGAIALFTLALLICTIRFFHRTQNQGGTKYAAKNQEK